MSESYDYVRRMYGVNPVIGSRVRHNEVNRWGTIVRASASHGHYVRVRFDGEKHASNCHPTALDYEAQP